MEGKQERKKKMGIKIVAGAGGGLAGIILLGGAFATAALVSTFVIKRKQHSNSNSNSNSNSKSKSKSKSKSTHNQKANQIDLLNKSKLKDDHELGSEGLSFLVPDSSSPLNHHHPSNGTADTQNELGSTQILILDETRKNEINGGGKDKEIVFSDFQGNYPLCDESCSSTVEFSFPVLDSSLAEKVNKKNDSLEEVGAKKVDEKVKVAHSNQVVVDDNREIPSNIEEKDEVCDGNGEIIVGKIEELVEATQTDQLGVDDQNLHEPGEECDDGGEITTVEKCEELVEAGHVENGVQLSEEQEATMDVDQEIICFGSSVTDRNEAETYEVNKADILLPVTGSSSLSKPGNDDSAEVHLIIESMQVMKRDETIEAVHGDQITIEDRPQAQLIEPEEKEEEPYEGDREITKCEEADQIAVENDDQEMQLSQYQDTLINGDQGKFISDKLSPESNSFPVYGVKVQEFSLPQPDGPLFSESRNLNEDNSAEAALHVEVLKPMEEDETAEEVLYDRIIVENNPPMQSSEKGQLENCNYCSGNVVAKGEEAIEIVHEDILQVFNNPKTQVKEEEDADDDDDDRVGGKNVDEAVETVHVDVVEVDKNPQTRLSEEEDNVNNGGSENGKEVVETVQTDVFKVENKLQTLLSEDEEEENDDEEDDEEESDGEEESVGKVEESSETTGDSSLESNAEAIWPAESVQELSLKLKELQANDQNLKETNGEGTKHNYQNGYVQSNHHNIKEEGGEGKFVRASTQKFMAETAALKQPIKFFNLKIWILSLLVLLLLVLWLHVAK